MFIQKMANTKNSLVMGVATNDANYRVCYKDENGKTVKCPYYTKWYAMLIRCYCPAFKKKRPSYTGCTLHSDWLLFSNFRRWMARQDWEGKHLDKDILKSGNKLYGPLTCIFVSPAINNITVLRENGRGEYPLGVSKMVIKGYDYFVASCSFYGKQKRLGYFLTVDEAHAAYLSAKNAHIQELADNEPDPRVAAALRKWVLR